MKESIDYDFDRCEAGADRYAQAVEDAIAAARRAPEGDISKVIYDTLTEYLLDWLSIEELIEQGDLPNDIVARLRDEEGY